jgi:ABC-type transport system involved in multi-copper enzyme maturation permease subunit
VTGFVRLLHAEWTKFRTVPGWVAGMTAAALMLVLVASLAGISSDQRGAPAVPIGPAGEPVTDSFFFVHRPLTGDGSLIVSVSDLTTRVPDGPADLRPGTVPWAKAGIIVKDGTGPGSPYAAIMVTGSHGVRMQHNYVHDTAVVSARPVQWLRLDRSGDAITGYASADGTRWTEAGTVQVKAGPAAQGGLFVASPPAVVGRGTIGSVSTAAFGDLQVRGDWAGGEWTGELLGAESPTFAGFPDGESGSFTASGGRITVTGAGDIAPAAIRYSLPTGGTIGTVLTGTFAALITVIVVGVLFISTEYRRELIHVTLAASATRGRVMLAKALVLGCLTFVAGLAGAAAAIPLGVRLARGSGVYMFPVSSATELRVALGTGALLATASILALSFGAVLRRSAAAVTAALLAIVLPYLLIANPFMPASVTDRLARVTPAAAFSVQQTLVPFPQVTSVYTPYNDYYPLAPWAGLAVLAGYAAASLAVAAVVLHRRDA